MYCRNCGNKVEEDAVFCIKCGTKTGTARSSLTQEAGNPAVPAKKMSQTVTAAKKKSSLAKKITACVLGMIGVGVLAAGICLVFLDKGTADSTTVPKAAKHAQGEEGKAGDGQAEAAAEVPAFAERAYELTEAQKWLLTEELSSASRYVTCAGNDWEALADEMPDKSILWLAMDVIKKSGNPQLFEWISGDSGDWYNSEYRMDADSFLTYLEKSFGRKLTRQTVANYMMGITLDSGADCFQWSGRTPEDSITAIIGPVITEARQISENRVRISGKYTGGMVTLEEAKDTFESEWEIDRSSVTCGLRFKSMKVHLVEMTNDFIWPSWGFQDNMEYVVYAAANAYFRNPSQGTYTVADIGEWDMMPLVRDMLLRNNLLGKEIQGELTGIYFNEAYADFTKEELEDFCENTLGCGFTDTIRANFEEISGGVYRLRFNAGDYGDVELEYIGNGTAVGDGIIEFTGSYRNCGDRMEVVVKTHRNKKSCFDGYTIDSVAFY